MSVEYKYKPDKHKYRVNIKSIDEVHKEHLEKFEKNRTSLPQKKKKLALLEKKSKDMENSVKDIPINLNMDELKKRNIIRSNIRKLKDDIASIENFSEEMQYYSIAGGLVYDYYELTNGMLYNNDFGQSINDEVEETQSDKLSNDEYPKTTEGVSVSKELLEITNSNKKRKIKRPVKKRNRKEAPQQNKTIMSYLLGEDEKKNEVVEDNTMCRATLQNDYLIMIDKDYACSKSRTNPISKCKNCNIDKIVIYSDSIMTCPKCGSSEDIFLESDIPSHKDAYNEKPKYPYKRICHCIEKLNQFLCKGTANVPVHVFTVLEEEVVKHGMAKDKITISFLEKMLKKHKLSDYYENIMYIFSKMTGTPPQMITHEEYELVLEMFREADAVYEAKYKPKNRQNFLKYTFVLHKIFLTLGKKVHASYFRLLKSQSKMKEQEKVWSLICADNGWTYHPSETTI